MATWQPGQCCTAYYDSKAATAIEQKLDAWELELDYRMAMVRFREERVKELEQRISELEDIERMHGQEKADNEEEEKTQEAMKALEKADEASSNEALGDARRLLQASCMPSARTAGLPQV